LQEPPRKVKDEQVGGSALWKRLDSPLQAEILVLRHQLNVLQRKSSNRVALSGIDGLLFMTVSIAIYLLIATTPLGWPAWRRGP
jgi:hypothetical protein